MAKAITREQIADELEQLTHMAELPDLYLANYFSDLRNEVDKSMCSQTSQQQDQQNRTKLNSMWEKMILKINLFEQQCINDKLNLEEFKKRIDLLQDKLNDKTVTLEAIHDDIDLEEHKLLQHLFQNKTIIYLNTSNLVNENLNSGLLIILNDEFIRFKSIEKR